MYCVNNKLLSTLIDVSITSFNTYVADGSDEGGVGFLIPAKTSSGSEQAYAQKG